MSEHEREESDEPPYGAGVAPQDLEAPIDAPPGDELPDESAAEAEKRRRSTTTRLSEPP